MLAEIDSAELTDWRAYYAIEPFGEAIADQRHGILTSTLANVNRDPKKTPEAYRPQDFIPWFRARKNADAPVLLGNAEAQASLVKRTLFGGLIKKAKK